jgi:putative FmdB family regulatory protein
MPTYEYECDVCGKRFDLRRHFGDPHPTECPDGHDGVHRIFAPPSIIFKDSGFYATDHGRNGLISQRTSKDEEPAKPEKQDVKPESKVGDKE